MHIWNVYDTFDAASQAAADFLSNLITETVQDNGICHVVLPGGNSPKNCLIYLSGKGLPWDKVHWYLGDERCLKEGDIERNDVMLNDALWSRISSTHIHRIPAELGAKEASSVYRKLVDKVGTIDIAFLGLGEDGHTASLFPGNKALNDMRSVVPVFHSPKPPSDRVSLGVSSLREAKSRIILTGGPAKADVIARIKSGEDLPVNRLGDIHWYIDQDVST